MGEHTAYFFLDFGSIWLDSFQKYELIMLYKTCSSWTPKKGTWGLPWPGSIIFVIFFLYSFRTQPLFSLSEEIPVPSSNKSCSLPFYARVHNVLPPPVTFLCHSLPLCTPASNSFAMFKTLPQVPSLLKLQSPLLSTVELNLSTFMWHVYLVPGCVYHDSR